MPGKHCGKKGRKHTPIVSKKQRGLFGAEYARKKAGKKGKTKINLVGIAGEYVPTHRKNRINSCQFYYLNVEDMIANQRIYSHSDQYEQAKWRLIFHYMS